MRRIRDVGLLAGARFHRDGLHRLVSITGDGTSRGTGRHGRDGLVVIAPTDRSSA